jgi:phage-related protein
LLIKIGERDMKRLIGFGIVLLSLVVALSLCIAIAQNTTLTEPANNSTVNDTAKDNKTMSLTDLKNVTEQLQNATTKLQDVTSQLRNVTQNGTLQNATAGQNITTLQDATKELQNATDKIQTAANPFANVKGHKPPSGR